MSDPDQHIWTIVHLMQKNCVLLRHLETYLDHPTEWILNLDYVIHQIEQILQLSKLTLKIFRQDCVSSVYQELLANIIKQYKDHYTRMKEKRMHVQAYIKSLVEILTINRHISPSELNKIAPEVCGICLEVHVMAQTLTSHCQHTFCQDCLQQWKKTCQENIVPLSCPTCRTIMQSVTCYHPKTFFRRISELNLSSHGQAKTFQDRLVYKLFVVYDKIVSKN